MGRIQTGRVILAGVIAGIVINILEFVLHGTFLGKDWKAAMDALGRTAQPGEEARSMILYIVGGFIGGFALAWLYAAIRPRFGAGPGTALKAGIGAWVFASLGPTLVQMAFGLFPGKLLYVPLIGDYIVYVVAALAGCWFYHEPEAAAA